MLDEARKQEVQRRIERSAVFQRCFTGPDADKVMEELKKNFTGAFNPDPYIHAYNAGQKSVLTFIENCLNADTKKAIDLLKGKVDE